MAEFEVALKITGLNEGGLSNNPHDHGGLTWAGIAYKYWPKWEGWSIVSKAMEGRTLTQANSILKNDMVLREMVKRFYKANFWDNNKIGMINDQQVANNVYDCGVNEGTKTAALFLQKAAGVIQDGVVGGMTIKAVNSMNAKSLYYLINGYRLIDYKKDAAQPGQGQFFNNWKSRLIDYVD